MITLLSTVFVLGVLIFVHEFGHFIFAKLFKIRVERFSLGYPPRMIGKKVGDTDYCLSWVPFGGYVKISGMVDESMDEEALKTPPKPWEFRSRPWIQRMLVVFAGPMMNIVFTFLIFWIGTLVVGQQTYDESSRVGRVEVNMPAEAAGVLSGDRVTSVNGSPVTQWIEMTQAIRNSGGETLELTVLRADSSFTLILTPDVREVDQDGQIVRVPVIGIGAVTERHSISFGRSFIQAGTMTWDLGKLIVESVSKLIAGRESIKNLAGPVGIAQMAGQSARAGWVSLISFMALLSLNLAILNLMPIPVLDGGHLLFLTIEGVIRREIPLKVKLIIQQVGMAVILVFMVLVIYNDVLRVFK